MIDLGSLKRSSDANPPRIGLYGTGGIGKTTLAMSAPNPVFIQVEDSDVEVPTFGLLRTFDEVMQAIRSLDSDEHDFETVALDSVDWLEPLIWAETCRRQTPQWSDIEAPGYGKGYAAALDVWREVFNAFAVLRMKRRMAIIMIAHAEVKKFDSPETEAYDRYQIKLNPRASALFQEHVDALLFANYRVSTVEKAAGGFQKKAVRGTGNGSRLLHTTERPAFLAKNRYSMPDTIPLVWEEIAKYIPFYQLPAVATNGNVSEPEANATG